jgi:hypothetical protein
MAASFFRFLDHTQRRNRVGRIPLDERSARRRDLYLTTHNTHNRQAFMTSKGFEPTVSVGKQQLTYAFNRTATGTGRDVYTIISPVVLYGCETWSLPLREEHWPRVFEKRVLRRIVRPTRDEVPGEWRKLHNEELHDLYYSPILFG